MIYGGCDGNFEEQYSGDSSTKEAYLCRWCGTQINACLGGGKMGILNTLVKSGLIQ